MTNEDKSPNEWRTIAGLAAELGVSGRTIRRRIDSGEYETKKEGGKILINADRLDARGRVMADTVSKDELIDVLRTQVTDLKGQLQQKDEQIKALQKQLDEASHRHDTVVMQMTRLLEYQQQPFWRRLFQRKQLPPPVDETTMGMEADEEKETSGS
jgi:hypothetical protein